MLSMAYCLSYLKVTISNSENLLSMSLIIAENLLTINDFFIELYTLLNFQRTKKQSKSNYSSQKNFLKFFPPPSHKIVTITAFSFNSFATRIAAKIFAPELIPTNRPSSQPNRCVIFCASAGKFIF